MFHKSALQRGRDSNADAEVGTKPAAAWPSIRCRIHTFQACSFNCRRFGRHQARSGLTLGHLSKIMFHKSALQRGRDSNADAKVGTKPAAAWPSIRCRIHTFQACSFNCRRSGRHQARSGLTLGHLSILFRAAKITAFILATEYFLGIGCSNGSHLFNTYPFNLC